MSVRFMLWLGVAAAVSGCSFDPAGLRPDQNTGLADARVSADGREPEVPDGGAAPDAAPDAAAVPPDAIQAPPIDAPESGAPGCDDTDRRWHAEFGEDPTQADDDGDSETSWVVRGSTGPLPASSIAEGMWVTEPNIPLDTAPGDDFSDETIVEVRMRDLSVDAGDKGAVFWINADWADDDSSFAPIFVSVRRDALDTQTVTLYGKSGNSVEVPLRVVPGFGTGWVTIGLRIDADNGRVQMWIDGMEYPEVSYPSFMPLASNLNERFATALGYGSRAAFDHVRVETCSSD